MQKLSFSIATEKMEVFNEAMRFHAKATKCAITSFQIWKMEHWTTVEIHIPSAYVDAFISLINNYQLNCPY
jgi:hypothetical protein